ncbi:MAG: hypothetical protein J0I06_19705 [Planctomycetes bacterium]|nr:hypothetical protein [Planctomycetota bacterium]
MTDAPPPEAFRPRWGAAGWALVLAAFAVGFYALPLKTIGPRADHLPGDAVDNRLNNFILEHGYRYLVGREPSFWDAPMLYPAAGATRTSDAHIGMLPAYATLRLCGLSPEGAFQGYFLIPFVLNFAAAAWGCRRLGFGPVAAAVGGYVFTFSLPVAAQLWHVQLFPRFLVPPALVFAWEFLHRPRAWRAWAVVGCVVGQTYLSVYIGYMLGLTMAVGAIAAAVLGRRELPWRELVWPGWRGGVARAAAVGAGALALLPLLYNHARGGGREGAPLALLRALAPRPRAWVSPPAPAATLPDLADAVGLKTSRGVEQQLMPGLLTLAALPAGLAAGLWRGRPGGRAAVSAAAWTVVALALVTTRFEDAWLYEPLTRLPGVRGIRAVGRIVLVALFPMGLVLGACAEAAVAAAGRAGRTGAACAAVLVTGAVVADHWLVSTTGPRADAWAGNRISKDVVVRRQAAIVEAVRRHPAPRLLYVFPPLRPADLFDVYLVQCAAMRASQDAGIPCVNGWSGYLPDGWYVFPRYGPLFWWLKTTGVGPDELAGLVIVGDPAPEGDAVYDAAMRATYPPQPFPPVP